MPKKKKQSKLKKTAPRPKTMKKTAKKQTAKNIKATPKKKQAKKVSPKAKKTVVKAKATTKAKSTVAKNKNRKKAGAKAASTSWKRVQRQSANFDSFTAEDVRARSAGQSGGLQGLSDAAGADSESVDELIEEGNAFEAGIVSGVEAADRDDEREVHTREVPEDDVPDEYLDQD
jgi:hypothetical protein